MRHIRTIPLLTLTLLYFLLVPSQAATEPVILADITRNERLVMSQERSQPTQPIEVKVNLPSIKDQLLSPAPTRRGTFGNSHVDIAPKSWPYPMVVSPGRPVLPGSAW